MESIPEDESAAEEPDREPNPALNPYQKARRRDSLCSLTSAPDSDCEQVRLTEILTMFWNKMTKFEC